MDINEENQKKEHVLVDSVLLIDGDNDPHLPADFPLTRSTLVRVFLRPEAKMPRPLERRLSELPMCITVASPKGGSNAADFVMSLHAGMLHATLPLHIVFTLVTADKSLSAMAAELQRIGRQAVLWTSHPEKARRRAPAVPRATGGRRTRSQPKAKASAPVSAPASASAPQPAAPAGPGRSLAEVAASYARRFAAIKDPPAKLKALLNDIRNRAVSAGHSAEAILEELKRAGAVSVDQDGKVHRLP